MKVKELLNEISASAKREARRKAADEKRAAAAAAAKAEAEALAAKIAKRTEKKLSKLSTPISATAPKKEVPVTGPFDNPQLEKYRIDPTVDTSFEGGYYLQFENVGKNVVAYWSRNPDATLQQMQVFNQVANLGSVFDANKFKSLLQGLVQKSGTPRNPGYVHVVLRKKDQASDWALTDPKNYFRQMFDFLAREYPRDEYTADATVNWEIA